MPQSTTRSVDLAPDQGPSEYWEPEVWSPRHALVARLVGAGLRNCEIAQATGFSNAKISQIRNDPRAKQFILEAVRNVADNILDLNTRLKYHATEALNEIIDQLRESRDEKVRQKAAFGILDRAGYTPISKMAPAAAPQIPEELASIVREAHFEMQEITRTVRFETTTQPSGRNLEGVKDEELEV